MRAVRHRLRDRVVARNLAKDAPEPLAVGYNAIAFPIAAGVFFPFVLSPEVAALSMSGSTLVVAINALMLKRIKLAGIRQPGKTTVSKATDPADQQGVEKGPAPAAVSRYPGSPRGARTP